MYVLCFLFQNILRFVEHVRAVEDLEKQAAKSGLSGLSTENGNLSLIVAIRKNHTKKKGRLSDLHAIVYRNKDTDILDRIHKLFIRSHFL